MSKLSFRARALDPSKQMPIYLAEELPDLPEYSAINRAVPQMPSGMEKEEESEHHLQRAICTGLIIPTPEVFTTDQDFYDSSYPPNYKMPRQLIHMQPLGLDNDVPEYDMDSSDEIWVKEQSQRLELTPIKFEQMMNRLERSSGQTVVTLNEAKALLKQSDEVSIAVYDYWLNKRLKTQHPLILAVKTENRPGVSSNNPYLAFRRRTEKMQTRKNRKNDETSYEKMLKLRRDLQRATTMLEMVKKREKTKKEQLRLSIEIFEKRVELRDFNGTVFNELCATLKSIRPAFAPLYSNQYSHNSSSLGVVTSNGASESGTSVLGVPNQQNFLGVCNNSSTNIGNIYTTSQYLSSGIGIDATNTTCGSISRKEKRQYKKRKHKLQRDKQKQPQQYSSSGVNAANMSLDTAGVSSLYSISAHSGLQNVHRNSSSIGNESNIETEEEEINSGGSHLSSSKFESEIEEETPFAFRRKQNCNYLKPLDDVGSWPWESMEEKRRDSDLKYRFTLTSLRKPRPKCIGFARRRVGRGGRIILDRVATDLDALWAELDYTILESGCANILNENIKKKTPIPTLNDCSAKPPKLKTENAIFDPMKSRNNRLQVRLVGRDDVDIENSYVSELTIPNKKQRNFNCSDYESVNKFEEECPNQQNYGTTRCKDNNILSNSLPHRHVLKISQTLKRTGISNILLNGNRGNDDDDSLGVVEKKYGITEQNTKKIGLNNNVNSNLNKNVSIGEKQNVIKCEAQQTTEENVFVQIKEEKEVTDSDSPRSGPIKDCNGLFNSIYRSISGTDICDDEENVNLAQLSNIMRHTIKREISEQVVTIEEKEKVETNSNEGILTKIKCNVENDVPWNEESLDSLSPTSSLRLEACNDLLNEIRNDWLHFRPKTPSNELSDDEKDRIPYLNSIEHPIVNWSQSTPISVEIVGASKTNEENNLWNKNQEDDKIFISNTFKYTEIEADSGILKSVYPFDDLGLKLKSTEYSCSAPANNKLLGLNLSGESLNDINLLGDSEETDSNMLDNILHQCQIDEISHTTNFWNGLLDADAAGVDEDDGTDIKNSENKDDRLNLNSNRNKTLKTNTTQGSTCFSVLPLMKINEMDFFKKSSPKPNINSSNVKNNSSEIINENLSSYNEPLNMENNQKLSCAKPISNDSLSVLEKIEDNSVKNNAHQDAQQLQVRHIAVQNQQQVQRQQILLQMQPDIVTSSGNAQYLTTQNNSTTIIRQPTLTPISTPSSSNNHVIYTTCSGDVFPVSHKVAYIQKAQNMNPNTVIALSNIKVENDGTQTATVLGQPSVNTVVSIDGGNNALGTAQNINIIRGSSVSGTTISAPSPLIVTTAGRSQHFTQQVQGQASQPQIVWRQISAAPNTTGATAALITTSTDSISGNKIVWTNRGAQKRHINGPAEGADINRLLLNRKPSQRKVISQHSQQVQISKQSLQSFQRDNDGSILSAQACSTLEPGHEVLSNTTQKLHGKVIKIPSFPLLVSELQQKQNSVSIASNQNFNLPTSSMISTQQVQPTTNKIVLSGAGQSSSCSSNVTSDLQSNANISQISVNASQKLHYKEIAPSSNMKLNFVSNTSSGNVGQANLVVDTKTITGQQPSTVLLNKSATSLQQQKLKTGSNIDNSKRVLYTSLLNVKNLQKTPSGQMQMQIGAGGMTHAVLRGRIANNQAIFTTNMRAVPIGSSVSSPGPPQTQALGTIVSGSITNNTFQDSQLKLEAAPHLTKSNETSKNSTDQSSCNSNSSISTTIGNIKLGNSVIISATNNTNKNTIVTSTTNR